MLVPDMARDYLVFFQRMIKQILARDIGAPLALPVAL